MTFANNPLGAAGYSPTVLPDMTAGIQALQRQEIQNELETIKRNKEWEREDRLRNQKLALEFAAPSTFDTLRQSQVEGFLNRKKAYEEKAAKFFGSGLPATSADYTKGLVELQRDKQALINETMKEKAFADAYSDLQGKFPAQYKSLETQEQKDQFNKQIADFVLKMKDPKQKVEVYDMIQAFTPPEPPTSYLVNKTAKELIPFVDNSIKSVGGGRTAVDFDKLKTAIASRMGGDDYLFEKGRMDGSWKTPDEMYAKVAEQVAPSIRTDVVGWKSDEPTEKEKIEGFEGRMKSSVNPDETIDAYIFTKGGSITGSYIPEGATKPTNAKIRPIGIRSDGKLEAEFTLDKEITTDPMDKEAALDLKDEMGGKISAPDKNGNYKVIYTRPVRETAIVPLTEDIAAKIRRADSGASKYLDNLDPYPQRSKSTQTKSGVKTNKYGI